MQRITTLYGVWPQASTNGQRFSIFSFVYWLVSLSNIIYYSFRLKHGDPCIGAIMESFDQVGSTKAVFRQEGAGKVS